MKSKKGTSYSSSLVLVYPSQVRIENAKPEWKSIPASIALSPQAIIYRVF